MGAEDGATSQQPQVDLTNCEREPIHQLGRVQSYGALLALSSDWVIQHASANLAAIIGIPAEDAVGKVLTNFVSPDVLRRIRAKLRLLDQGVSLVRLFSVDLLDDGRTFDVSAHQADRRLILECEPKRVDPDRDDMAEVYPLVSRVRRHRTLEDMANAAAQGLKALTGFDRVMVYRFAPDQSGQVIAEEKAPEQVSYLHLRFPASDIPTQARRLYTQSLLRLIADVNDPGAPILPEVSNDGQPLDLSLAVTRAVSPIHLEYLRNMGVGASMSVSILNDDKLWGLFACHHDSPHYIDFELRSAVELFAQLFAYELAQYYADHGREVAERARALHDRLMLRLSDGEGFGDDAAALSGEICQVIDHDGLILFTDDGFSAHGTALTQEEFGGLARFLNGSAQSAVFATADLARVYPPAADFASRVAGLMAIPISRRPRDYVVLCRKEIVQQVSWGGNPEKPVEPGPNGVRLTPRKSFEAWRQVVKGQSAPWRQEELQAAELLRVSLLEIVLKITDAANRDRRKAQERQELLISELNHRVRNILNLIRGLVSQSVSSTQTTEDFTKSLDGRIQALARAHDQLTQKEWTPSSLKGLLEVEVSAYLDRHTERVSIAGPDALLSPVAFSTLALVFHEMVTNSAKYGALSCPVGRLEITLTRHANGDLRIVWCERGGPPVKPPTREGFGTTILEKSIPYELRGEAEVHYRVGGVEAEFTIPCRFISDAPDQLPQAARVAQAPRPEAGVTGKALVLEDTMIIAMDAAEMLQRMGAPEVMIAADNAEAAELIEANDFSVALLDVNLGSETSLPTARMLADQGVPFLLATGYGENEQLKATFPSAKVIRKPYTSEMIADALAELDT